MADKVFRFTADDSGYSAAIDRMAAKVRDAFSNVGSQSKGGEGLSSLLSEADSKFTDFADKVKYIKDELTGIKGSNRTEFADRMAEVDNSKDTAVQKNRIAGSIDKEYQSEQKTIDKLIDALDKLSDRIGDKSDAKKDEDSGGNIVDRVKKTIKQPSETEQVGEKIGSSLGGVGVGALIGGMLGNVFAQVAERLVGAVVDVAKQGQALARTEKQQATMGRIDTDDIAENDLGISNTEHLAFRNKVIAGRHLMGTRLTAEAHKRAYLQHGYAGVTDQEFGGLDNLFRERAAGGSTDKGNYDATRTITEILQRSEREGILGVSGQNLTLLPEKIAQVTAIANQQYQRTGTTDLNSAINLVVAGQKIGGRFEGNLAGDAFNNLGRGISDPGSAGMKAYITQAIHRLHPEMDPYEIKAQMQKGLTAENIAAIFPGINATKNKVIREGLFDKLTGGANTNDALALARNGGNLLNVSAPLTDKQILQKEGDIHTRAVEATVGMDKAAAYFNNTVTAFAQSVVLFGQSANINLKASNELKDSVPAIKANELKKAGSR